MVYLDREEAGRELAAALEPYRQTRPVILALPRGGVPVAARVAAALDAPLDVVLVRKVGAPADPELAMGAIAEWRSLVTVRNEAVIAALHIPLAAFDAGCRREAEELVRRRRRYVGDRPPLDVKDRTVIVIDDGLATGATMRAALRAVRAAGPKALVLATPVAARDSLESLRPEADAVVCPDIPEPFRAVGFHYVHFSPVTDEEVIAELEAARVPDADSPI